MPRYFFDVHDGTFARDEDGVELESVDAARKQVWNTLPAMAANRHANRRHGLPTPHGRAGRERQASIARRFSVRDRACLLIGQDAMKKASEYRKHAEECRSLARGVQGPQRDQLLEMAATWATWLPNALRSSRGTQS